MRCGVTEGFDSENTTDGTDKLRACVPLVGVMARGPQGAI